MGAIQHLYETGQITSEEMDKLSSIRSGLLEAMGNGYIATVDFIKEAFEGSTPEELEVLDRIIDHVETKIAREVAEEHGPEGWLGAQVMTDAAMLKLAAPSAGAAIRASTRGAQKVTAMSRGLSEIWKAMPAKKWIAPAASASILATLGLSLLGAARHGIGLISQPIRDMLEKQRLRTQSTDVFTDIVKANPELKKDKNTLEHFQMLQRYAPNTVATNKPVAEAMLKKMQQWGQVDPLSLQQMIKMEREHVQNIRDRQQIPEFHAPKTEGLAELIGAGQTGGIAGTEVGSSIDIG